jgi:hypothetical protein
VPESAERSALRKRLARRAADRRQAVTLLQITECTARYAASQLGNGASPEEARATALFVAGELAETAAALRRLTRLGPAERRALAAQLAALGMGPARIAARLGVSERCARYYVAGQSSRGRVAGLPADPLAVIAGHDVDQPVLSDAESGPGGDPNTYPGPWPLRRSDPCPTLCPRPATRWRG